MPDNNAPISAPMVDAYQSADDPSVYRRAAIMDLMTLILIVIGITVAVIGVYIAFGIGVALIVAGVALVGMGIALGYR